MLDTTHHKHLIDDGFNEEEVEELISRKIVETWSIKQALDHGFGASIPMSARVVLKDDLFLYFAPMQELRVFLKDPIIIEEDLWNPKYLSLKGSNTGTWLDEADYFVEGVKDALIIMFRTGLLCGAFKGCWQAQQVFGKRKSRKAPVFIFDSDLKTNDDVRKAARRLKAAHNPLVSCFQSLTKMGGTEFFAQGGTVDEFRRLTLIDYGDELYTGFEN